MQYWRMFLFKVAFFSSDTFFLSLLARCECILWVCDSARALLFHSCVLSSERVLAGRKVTELTFCAEQACSNCDSFAVWLILLHVMWKVFIPGSKYDLLLTALGQCVNDCLLCLTLWNASCTCSNLIRNRTLLQKMSLRRCTKHCRCTSHLYSVWIACRLHWSALPIYVDTSIFTRECTELESRGWRNLEGIELEL